MDKLSIQDVLGHPKIWEAISESLRVQKETGFESCFIATWNGKEMIVNKVAHSESEHEIDIDVVSQVEGHGYNESAEGQIVFNFHSHPTTSFPYPSPSDISVCRHFQWINRWQWEVDSDVQHWCNPLFGIGTPNQEEITVFQVPPRWVLLGEDDVNTFMRKAVQVTYEQVYGERAKKGRHWSPDDSSILSKFFIFRGGFPPFLYPGDKQRLRRYQKFLERLRIRLAQQIAKDSLMEPEKGYYRLWASF